jgi:hypothetical protein
MIKSKVLYADSSFENLMEFASATTRTTISVRWPKPLDKKVEEELKRIINSAEKELVY